MGWSNNVQGNSKKKMDTSSKVLLTIITCVIITIILVVLLIILLKQSTFVISVDGKNVTTTTKNNLLTNIEDVTYINIEEFAKIVGYEYHQGEYKAFTIEEDKCYVQGKEETATFYLNDNKICKLPVNKISEDYREFSVANTVREINGKMYVPIDAIKVAFNVSIKYGKNSLEVLTLEELVKQYNQKVKAWGYNGISEQSFENKKSLLYGYLIVKKENGLYKIIDNQNKQEIVSDKYNSIEFSENTEEFFVTNSLGQVGIINLNGTTKIEPVYESISVFDKELDLYLIKKDNKYGVVKSGNITIISPEYDSIGLDSNNLKNNIESQYFILDTLIPVCKENKWGAFNKEGTLIYKIEYDTFGCNITTADVEGTNKEVESVLAIEKCNGVVVSKEKKYGVLDVNGKELVPIVVDSIYALHKGEDEEREYFMVYNGRTLNIIERLIATGIIKDNNSNNNENVTQNTNNSITNSMGNISTNTVTNNVTNTSTNIIINNTITNNSTIQTSSNIITNNMGNNLININTATN